MCPLFSRFSTSRGTSPFQRGGGDGSARPRGGAVKSEEARPGSSLPGRRLLLKNGYIAFVLAAVPAAVFLMLRDPVGILSIGGIISDAHLPVVVSLTLYLNIRRLPREFGPGPLWTSAAVAAILFFAFFSGFYFYGLLFRPESGAGIRECPSPLPGIGVRFEAGSRSNDAMSPSAPPVIGRDRPFPDPFPCMRPPIFRRGLVIQVMTVWEIQVAAVSR
jgi:hypothetical protein